ncbi:MarR family transcriptional regulator [Nonomuraea sp. NPDC050556]|uniref:GbsR/MarR family transcriptional regulator n=1 Tax=Nonomuraea sp. NPDC050556 TaxID=3364369 RepID=UPI0037AF5CB7
MPGDRLTDEDRQQIAAGLAEGLAFAEIGRRLGRPASTVMREVSRNGGPDGYRAHQAQEATRNRARRTRKPQAQPRPMGDSSHGRDPRAVQDLTESFATLLEQQGMPKMAARVLACLYVADSGTLTAADLVQRLRVSPASISQTVGFLEQQGLIKREREPGGRREHYVVDDELWVRSTQAALTMNDTLVVASQRAAEILGPTTPAGARFDVAAEFLQLVSTTMHQMMDQWNDTQTARTSDLQP